MQLLILLSAALALGYWLSHSQYHESIDKAAQQPRNRWNRLFHRSETGESAVEESISKDEKEN